MTDAHSSAFPNKAQEASTKAYAPYSNFPVGAAILCEDGTVFTGCNVENASYGLTNCAERTAVFKAISEGNRDFKAIAIWAEKTPNHHITPCGACRQVIAEFFPPDALVYWTNPETGEWESEPVSSLLPHQFSL